MNGLNGGEAENRADVNPFWFNLASTPCEIEETVVSDSIWQCMYAADIETKYLQCVSPCQFCWQVKNLSVHLKLRTEGYAQNKALKLC